VQIYYHALFKVSMDSKNPAGVWGDEIEDQFALSKKIFFPVLSRAVLRVYRFKHCCVQVYRVGTVVAVDAFDINDKRVVSGAI